MHDAWFSYDAIASEYFAVAEQIYFAGPADDLVRFLELREADILLDIGSGSGVVGATAARSGHKVRVISCDVSMAMLRVARERLGDGVLVLAALPQLPFSERTFDAATASFVLSHIADVNRALTAIRSFLKSGGRLGVTSWSSSAGESPPGQLWDSLAREVIPGELLQEAATRNLPSENRLSSLDDFAELVHRAGFTDVTAVQRPYAIDVDTKEFVRSRRISAASRYLTAHLPAAAWATFVAAAESALHDQFGQKLNLRTTVNFVIARRAA